MSSRAPARCWSCRLTSSMKPRSCRWSCPSRPEADSPGGSVFQWRSRESGQRGSSAAISRAHSISGSARGARLTCCRRPLWMRFWPSWQRYLNKHVYADFLPPSSFGSHRIRLRAPVNSPLKVNQAIFVSCSLSFSNLRTRLWRLG